MFLKSIVLLATAHLGLAPVSIAQTALSQEASLQADFIAPNTNRVEKIRRLSRGLSDLLQEKVDAIVPADQGRILGSLVQLRNVISTSSLVGGGGSSPSAQLLLNETTTKPVSRKSGGAFVFYSLNESSKISSLQVSARPVNKESGIGGVVISEVRLLDNNNSVIGGGPAQVRIGANKTQALQINTLEPVKYIQVKVEGMQQDFLLQATVYGAEVGDGNADPITVEPWPVDPGPPTGPGWGPGHGPGYGPGHPGKPGKPGKINSQIKITATCNATALNLNSVDLNTGENKSLSIPMAVIPRAMYCDFISNQINQKFTQATQGKISAFQFGVCNFDELRIVTMTNSGQLVEAPPTKTSSVTTCLSQASTLNQFGVDYRNPCDPSTVHILPSGEVADINSFRAYLDSSTISSYRKLTTGSKFSLTTDLYISEHTKNMTKGVRLRFIGGPSGDNINPGSEAYYDVNQLFATAEIAPLRECFR